MTLAVRLLLPPVGALALAAAAAGGLLAYQRQMEQTLTEDARRGQRTAELVGRLSSDSAAIQIHLLSYRIERRQAHLDAIVRADLDMARDIDAYVPLVSDARERDLLRSYLDSRNETLRQRLVLLRAIHAGDAQGIRVAYDGWSLMRARLSAQLDDLVGLSQRSQEATLQAARAQTGRFIDLAGIGIAATLAATLAYALFVLRRVARPLGNLLAGIRMLGTERFDARIDGRLERARDEIGSLARAFNEMAGRLQASTRKLEAEIGERRRAQDELLQANGRLELRVQQRTAALAEANLALKEEIAERIRAEESLRRRHEELARFNRIASHDLSEPLRQVAGYVGLLAQRYRDRFDAEADTFIGHALEGVARMKSILDDMVEYAQVGIDKRPLRAVDAEGTLRARQQALAERIAQYGATLTWDTLPVVNADEALLAQVFHALLDNALKFHGPEAPRIHVSARREGDFWRIGVSDNGIGIAPEHHERIFGIFQRLHGREDYPGNGMGLALCRRIVERFGGEIRVASEPGRGAVFSFTVPAL